MTEDATTLYLAVAVLIAGYGILTSFILPAFSTENKYLRAQSWTGIRKQWFATWRAGINSVLNSRSMILEGYEEFSKNGKLFVLPQFFREPFVLLPADKVHEFLSQGDDKVDHQTVGGEAIANKWTMHKILQTDTSHFDVVRRQLTRKLPLLTADVYSELVLAMENQWPAKANEWTTVKTYTTCMKIVSRAANRVFSGKDLCRVPEYLDSSRLYSQAVFKTGALLKLTPRFLHFIVAPLLMREVNHHLNICRKHSLPVIKSRLQQMQALGKAYDPPHDVLQWVLDDALQAPDNEAYRRDPDFICQILLILNMVAIHTTSMVTTNAITDIYTSPSADDFVAGLREEAERVYHAHNDEWSKDAVNQLLRVDSAIRETMRFTGLSDIGLPRVVSAPDGINLSGGIKIPKGVRVSVPAHAIHLDEKFYPNATQYDAFRFSRPREDYEAQVEKEHHSKQSAEHLEKVLDLKNRGLIVTTDDFFSFGFGRHACPGRFFASQEMKLMLAHVVMNYDIEIKGPRPENMLINGASVPKDSFEMNIRLRSPVPASA